jgi:hypothetical protein
MDVRLSSLAVSDYAVIAEAYLVKNGRLGALRSWMDTTWHPSRIKIEKSQLHNLIVDLDFPIIYTTNYDRWLEKAFEKRGKSFHKIANMADLAPAPNDQTHIIKFHGDFEDNESLVLTEASLLPKNDFRESAGHSPALGLPCAAYPLCRIQSPRRQHPIFAVSSTGTVENICLCGSATPFLHRYDGTKCAAGNRPHQPGSTAHSPQRQKPRSATTAFLRQLLAGVRSYKAKEQGQRP